VTCDASSSKFGHLIDDIVMVLSSFPCWQIGHVRRDSNRAAHGLAETALKNVFNRRWEFSIPDCIGEIVLSELSAII
jgi:hypothetical protein